MKSDNLALGTIPAVAVTKSDNLKSEGSQSRELHVKPTTPIAPFDASRF